MKIKILDMFDWVLFFSVIMLTGLGIAFIYSSGINSNGVLVSNEFIKQIVWAVIGLAVMTVMAVFDYRKSQKYTFYLFIGIIILLIYTRLFGRYVKGARSWIGIGDLGIQPSEISKIVFILFLANYLQKSKNENPRIRFFKALGIMIVPMGLILIQPDLGTASVYIPIFLCMCLLAGIQLHYLIFILAFGFLSIIFTVLPIWETEIAHTSIPVLNILKNNKLRFLMISVSGIITILGLIGRIVFKNKPFYWIAYVFGIIALSFLASYAFSKVLKPYQISRLIVFLDPSSDPRGAGWNIIQSKIAIGSGNLAGRGFLRGTQSHYRFLPEQSTDFIFSILAEETGFLGGIFVFALFLIMMFRILQIIVKTNNQYGAFIASGILGMFFFHFMVNVGMVMGIMPITGIPLPFLSYGGSALLTNMISVGLLMSINYRHLDLARVV